jgi:hypothetical protein
MRMLVFGLVMLLWPAAALAQQDSPVPHYKSRVAFKREFGCKPDPIPPAANPQAAVSYSPKPTRWLKRVTIRTKGSGEDAPADAYALEFFDFGGVTGGTYAGSRLLVAKFYSWRERYPQDVDSALISYQRYVLLKDNRLVRLTALSEAPKSAAVYGQLLQQLKVSVAQDDGNFRLQVLEAPVRHIAVNNLCLTYWEQIPDETDGDLDTIGTHPLYGRFYVPGKPARDISTRRVHYVHAKLPDGTVLAYYLLPPPALDNLAGKVKERFSCFDPGYMADKAGGLSGPAADVTYSPAITPGKLKLLYDLPGIGPAYVLRKPPERMAYADYKAMWEEESKNPEPGANVKKIPLLTAAEYARLIHEFYWKDPLGRWVLFENSEQRIPTGAEPLIYLYPAAPQSISVQVGSRMQIVGAIPPLSGNSWQVQATPDGVLSVGGGRFESLFWEWKWVPLAPPESGFVVQRENLEAFFESVLPELGLNEREAREFRQYWVGRMQAHPYYLVAFLDRETIDAIAPLEISPAPDTTIRVLMDFVALDAPLALPGPKLPPRPVRRGFVAVEWGGMSR